MKFRIGLWVVVVLLSAIYFFICFMYYSASYPDEGPVLFFQAIEFLVFLIMFLVPSLLVTTLLAFIPLRERDYKEKLLRILPITLVIFLAVLSLILGFAGYIVEEEGRQSGPLTKYENIEIPETLDCTTVHEGSFANKAGVFSRSGNRQVETLQSTGEKTEYEIEWIGNCEYILRNEDDHSEHLRCKITDVSPEFYFCEVLFAASKSAYARHMRIEIVTAP